MVKKGVDKGKGFPKAEPRNDFKKKRFIFWKKNDSSLAPEKIRLKGRKPKKVMPLILTVIFLAAVILFLLSRTGTKFFKIISADTSTIFSIFLILALVILLLLRKIMETKSKEAKDTFRQKSSWLSFLKKKKTEDAKGEEQRKVEEKKEQKLGTQSKASTSPLEQEILSKKKKKLNVALIFLLGFGVIGLLISLLLTNPWLKISMGIIVALLVLILIKQNWNHRKKVKYTAFNPGEYKDLTDVLNKVSDLNKQKDALMKQVTELSSNIQELEKKRTNLLSSKEKNPDAALASSITIVPKDVIDRETKKSTPIREKKVIRSKEFETDMDLLIELVDAKEHIKLSDAAKFFNVSIKKIEELAKILEEHNLIKIHYPTFGEIELNKLRKETDGKKNY